MKQQQWKAGLIVASAVAMIGSVAVAAAPVSPEHEELFWPEAWAKFHNPTPWLSMGLDHRFRSVWAENVLNLDEDGTGVPRNGQNEWEYQRYRTRWWTKSVLSDDISFNTRLTWEFRTWDEPFANRPVDFDEALFDWFNFNLQNVGGMPLTATIGRQDIIFGVGWLVLDGTPLDGSRTSFFDAARFTYMLEEQETKIDLIYIDQAAESDRWLEPISDENRALTKEDERGVILYLTNKSFENTQLEGFFIYKNDNPVEFTFENPWPVFAYTRKAEIFTFGAAISGTSGENWRYRAEGAVQTGERSENTFASSTDLSTGAMHDLEAYGLLTNLEYLFKDPLDNSVHIGYEYASGDDPSTSDDEMFDPLWGEWPRWSELFLYTWTFETSVGEGTNLHRANIGHKIQLNKQWQLATDYHALWADEHSGALGLGSLTVSNDHKFRGHLFTMWAKYTFSPQLYGHLLGEYFKPGAYYGGANDDEAFFLRFNLEYTF